MPAEFCDTNVLVYAYDTSAGSKRDQARALVDRLWVDGSGVISVQILQELFVALTQRIANSLPPGAAREVVADMAAWRVVEPTAQDVLDAVDGVERWQISFWDAMVLTAARKGAADVVWSEDLNDGQRYDGVLVRNPFV